MYAVADEIAKAHLRLVKIKDEFVAAACPFHKGGQERRPSFWINRHNGEWGCFACPESGSDLRFLLKRLGASSRALEAALDSAQEEAKKHEHVEKAKKRRKARAEFRGEHILPEALLGVYDWCPVRLLEEGFEEETLRMHDIGFDRGRERITFPIRDVFGNLIGISGRTVQENGYPKYKVYEGWTEKDGVRYPGELGEWFPEYSATNIRDHLWRGHFVYDAIYQGHSNQLIIVEGYKAAMWLVQHGWANTVALMGARMSYAQERLIRRMGTETWIFLDNNEAGITGTQSIGDRLGNATFPVYLSSYPSEFDEDIQPSDLKPNAIEDILMNASRARGKKKHAGHRQQL